MMRKEPEFMSLPMTSAIILAGGKGSRMGYVNKALLKANEETFLDIIIKKLRPCFHELLISVDQEDRISPIPGIKIVADKYPPGASIIGLYSGLTEMANDWGFVVACDMPLLDIALVQFMMVYIDRSDVVIPIDHNRMEPFHAFYRRSCIRPLQKMIEAGEFTILHLLDQVRTFYVDIAHLGEPDRWRRSYRNINTPEEYSALAELSLS
jgi:molybdopterin-guanine dinucleotide biosynthesis protein A